MNNSLVFFQYGGHVIWKCYQPQLTNFTGGLLGNKQLKRNIIETNSVLYNSSTLCKTRHIGLLNTLNNITKYIKENKNCKVKIIVSIEEYRKIRSSTSSSYCPYFVLIQLPSIHLLLQPWVLAQPLACL